MMPFVLSGEGLGQFPWCPVPCGPVQGCPPTHHHSLCLGRNAPSSRSPSMVALSTQHAELLMKANLCAGRHGALRP